MDGATLGVKKKFKEYRNQTQNLIKELENTINNFEKDGDIKELSSKLKEAIQEFQKSEHINN